MNLLKKRWKRKQKNNTNKGGEKPPANLNNMEILQYDLNGFPLYWFDNETMKVWKRIDKNTSKIVRTPKRHEKKVLNFRLRILNSK